MEHTEDRLSGFYDHLCDRRHMVSLFDSRWSNFCSSKFCPSLPPRSFLPVGRLHSLPAVVLVLRPVFSRVGACCSPGGGWPVLRCNRPSNPSLTTIRSLKDTAQCRSQTDPSSRLRSGYRDDQLHRSRPGLYDNDLCLLPEV